MQHGTLAVAGTSIAGVHQFPGMLDVQDGSVTASTDDCDISLGLDVTGKQGAVNVVIGGRA